MSVPPANEVCEGYVFTDVCLSRGVVCLRSRGVWQTTPEQTPPQQTDTPGQCMLGYGQQAGGAHPTGMHSCLRICA